MPTAYRRIVPLLKAGVAMAMVGLGAACHRPSGPGSAAKPKASLSAQPGAAASPAGPAAGKLPEFKVAAVSTEEGNAVWYDVPAGSLAQRRAWPEEMTAASDKLATETYARVTRLESGKSVIVRITDHHVDKRGAVIDVDRAAAEALGLIKLGKARVKVEVLALKNADAAGPSPKESPTKESGASQEQEKAAAQRKPGT